MLHTGKGVCDVVYKGGKGLNIDEAVNIQQVHFNGVLQTLWCPIKLTKVDPLFFISF